MTKIVVVFLGLMLIISMIGSLVTKVMGTRPPEPPKSAQTRAKCGHCGRAVVGTAPCICGKG